jgi:hypothetical protein
MDDKISLKCIHDLLDYHFIIPSYQRGYRWTDQQVNDLLDDIWEFSQKAGKTKDEFYCLQPVVVALGSNGYSVIDGQQRLTTIYIIFSVLKDIKRLIEEKNFTIEFETRKDSERFLQNIDLTRKDENIDYYHICRAFETIERWFTSKPGTVRLDFLNSLLRDDKSGNNVKVIWYEIDSAMDPIDIFTRINMGKIPLTNAELVKALFLKRENFERDENLGRLRQLELANAWDSIEYSLRNEQFWYFLTDEKDYENRIELIFDLTTNTSPASSLDRYHTFRYFNQRCNEPADVETIWQGIKNYFLTFSEWFDNRKYYHLVGYLIALGEELGELKHHSSQKTKSEFEQYLMEKIRSHVRCNIDELNYEEDKNKIKQVLLLFNIITLLNSINSNERFQFGRYKRENWDIEHIHAVQSEMPLAAIHQVDWLKEVLQFTDDEDMKNRISRYINTSPELRSEIFETLYNDIVRFYSESGLIEDIQDISNLALLDSGTNRGLQNAVFPIKRKVIIEKDRKGLFLPLCTKNVFLKYYSGRVEQMTFWGKTDRQAYLGSIKQTLARFIED